MLKWVEGDIGEGVTRAWMQRGSTLTRPLEGGFLLVTSLDGALWVDEPTFGRLLFQAHRYDTGTLHEEG